MRRMGASIELFVCVFVMDPAPGPVLAPNSGIYAPYNVLSNWSNGRIALRHFFQNAYK
jgi:hypothetical protein